MKPIKFLFLTFLFVIGIQILNGCGGGSNSPDPGDGSATPPITPPPVTLPSCKDGYCLIPEGSFQMGSLDTDPEAKDDEKPAKQVTVSGFLIGKTEVTVGQYKKVLNLTTLPANLLVSGGSQTPMNGKGDNFPIVGLTFDEKRAFCMADKGELPTAAQIERASKGVSGTDRYGTPLSKAIIFCNAGDTECSQQFNDMEVVCGNNDERANSFGVCDLAGNVMESVLDKYEDDFYSRMPLIDPYNILTNQMTQPEELRGGTYFDSNRVDARAATRTKQDLSVKRPFWVGFRCARPLPQ